MMYVGQISKKLGDSKEKISVLSCFNVISEVAGVIECPLMSLFRLEAHGFLDPKKA